MDSARFHLAAPFTETWNRKTLRLFCIKVSTAAGKSCEGEWVTAGVCGREVLLRGTQQETAAVGGGALCGVERQVVREEVTRETSADTKS